MLIRGARLVDCAKEMLPCWSNIFPKFFDETVASFMIDSVSATINIQIYWEKKLVQTNYHYNFSWVAYYFIMSLLIYYFLLAV